MKKSIFLLLHLLAFSLIFSCAATAANPSPPKLKAKAYILLDFNSQEVIAELKSDDKVEPASLTKMMTSYVVEQELIQGNIQLSDMVRISEKAWRMKGSRMFLEVGTRVSVDELMKGIIIQSGNDASVALAEHIAGSEEAFVSLMNEYARILGMNSTNFVNATGLPHKKHYTTPRDLATLVSAIIRDFPEHYAWYSEKEYTYNGIRQFNRNKLLWQDESVDGVKTGHTESAGFCLAASAKKGDMRLISVVLGTNSETARTTESQKLLTFGFRFYETHKLYKANQPLTTAKIWKGETELIPLGLEEDLYITIPRGSYSSLKATMSIDKKITAPGIKGKVYGSVNIGLKKEPFIARDLIALKNVNKGSLMGSLFDEVQMRFE